MQALWALYTDCKLPESNLHTLDLALRALDADYRLPGGNLFKSVLALRALDVDRRSPVGDLHMSTTDRQIGNLFWPYGPWTPRLQVTRRQPV